MTRRSGDRKGPVRRARRDRLVASLAVLLVVAAAPAAAQYFGRNKVLWERFDFVVLESEHFLVHYYPRDAGHGEYVARLAERWYARLAKFFEHELDEKKLIIVYEDHADFQQTVVTPELIGEGTGGFTESLQDRVVLPLTGIHAENDHVIGHELVHVFQFDLLRQRTAAPINGVTRGRLPLWAIEGLAEYLSQGRHDPITALWMRDAALHDRLPDPDAFIQEQPSPYQYGQAVWAYIAGRWGDAAVRRVFVGALTVGLAQAFERELGMTAAEFFRTFHADLREAYAPAAERRLPPERTATPLLTREQTGSGVNVAPSLSPDGRRIAFLSTRELALELYVADAGTGEVLRKLVSAEGDRHFENLSFIEASVAWSPDGERFAFSVFDEGERRLAVYDVASGRVTRQIDLEEVEDMRHPAWTPDGRAVVFSGGAGESSDLYRVAIDNGEVTRLTADPYTAIQPAVSPDGSRVVFVTDRGPDTSLDRLDFGPLRLAVLEIATGKIELLPIAMQGRQLDPEFSADGRSLFFIGEPDGVPDLFRFDFADGRVTRLTRLQTGVSGITGLSPSLSVAGDRIAFSALRDGDWAIYTMPVGEGEPVTTPPDARAGVLPPADPVDAPGIVEAYLAQPLEGLPSAGRVYPVRPYVTDLGLAAIGPAAVGVGTWSTGPIFAGAFGAYFNDALNRHRIVTTVQGGSTQGALDFEDTFGGGVAYLNQTRRFQWGASLSRTPYVSSAAFLSTEAIDVDGRPVIADVAERLIEAVQVSEASLIGQYPFSLNNRMEALVGVTRIDYELELERLVVPRSGSAPFREFVGLPSPAALDLRQAGVAFVRDTSRFGFVSPVLGTRFRVENRWATGDLDFRTTLVDYRRYFFRRPLTFALRLLHIGRRGDGAEDPRLPPLDIADSTLVRGYELGSFDVSECTFTANRTRCPELDRLIGSRIAVLNFELRVPLLGTEDFGLFDFPAAPTQAAFFIDVGAAWISGESVELEFERDTAERVPVVSAGIAARSLLFGALPVEVFYAVPFQRPDEDRVFGFRIGVAW